MKKNIVAGIVAIICIAVAGHAAPVSALSIEDLQAQIKELLTKVANLQLQLRMATSVTMPDDSTSTPTISPAKYRICSLLARNLAQGTQGDDVRGLQEFLNGEGYLSANATGYFGPATAQAVAKWQSSQGVSSVGSFGPLSRERIKLWCGGGNTERFAASPQYGPSPLTVTFKTNVQLANPQMIADAGDYKIVFGDGAEYVLPCTGANPSCNGPHTAEHMYSSQGTYTASLVHFGYFGIANPDGSAPQQTVGTMRIVVGGSTACTKEYGPVCGSKSVVCIKAPCNPVQQTYGNRCQMSADGATFLYEGACRPDSANPEKDPQCKTWVTGTSIYEREYPGGPARLAGWGESYGTLPPARCTAYFDGDSGNKPPTISSFSGPTLLAVNAAGTWTINALDPENGQLTYQIWWGDENVYLPSMNAGAAAREFVQNTTFTHAYASAGTYTVSIVVRDAAGGEAKASATLKVGSDSVVCTAEYAPVCGRPSGCANTCAPGMYCTMMCQLYTPVTYSNRCQMNAAGATFLYSGQCTSNTQ